MWMVKWNSFCLANLRRMTCFTCGQWSETASLHLPPVSLNRPFRGNLVLEHSTGSSFRATRRNGASGEHWEGATPPQNSAFVLTKYCSPPKKSWQLPRSSKPRAIAISKHRSTRRLWIGIIGYVLEAGLFTPKGQHFLSGTSLP